MKRYRVDVGVIGNGKPNVGFGRTSSVAFANALKSRIQPMTADHVATAKEYFESCRNRMFRNRYAASETTEKVVYVRLAREH